MPSKYIVRRIGNDAELDDVYSFSSLSVANAWTAALVSGEWKAAVIEHAEVVATFGDERIIEKYLSSRERWSKMADAKGRVSGAEVEVAP